MYITYNTFAQHSRIRGGLYPCCSSQIASSLILLNFQNFWGEGMLPDPLKLGTSHTLFLPPCIVPRLPHCGYVHIWITCMAQCSAPPQYFGGSYAYDTVTACHLKTSQYCTTMLGVIDTHICNHNVICIVESVADPEIWKQRGTDCKPDAIDHVIAYARLGTRTRSSWLSLATEPQTY